MASRLLTHKIQFLKKEKMKPKKIIPGRPKGGKSLPRQNKRRFVEFQYCLSL
jgi:hypothetical protein